VLSPTTTNFQQSRLGPSDEESPIRVDRPFCFRSIWLVSTSSTWPFLSTSESQRYQSLTSRNASVLPISLEPSPRTRRTPYAVGRQTPARLSTLFPTHYSAFIWPQGMESSLSISTPPPPTLHHFRFIFTPTMHVRMCTRHTRHTLPTQERVAPSLRTSSLMSIYVTR
jgi:hypothetical protein